MADYDLVIRGGTVATASDTFTSDVGIRGETIVAMGTDLGTGAREIDARGMLVMPGGVDSHCHIEQRSSGGAMCADDFYSGTVAAAFGGTTTVIPFAAQHKGDSLIDVVREYHEAADPKAVIDYAFHLILSDPREEVLRDELPGLIDMGYTSFKVYLTYDALKLDDGEMLDVLSLARKEGALVMVHAENHEVIKWLTDRLLSGGYGDPKYHAISHPRIAEGEATHRAIALAELLDTPLLIVHVSSPDAIHEIREAKTRGLKVFGETCPQYLFLTAKDLDRDGMEGAKYCCSPPPRDEASQEAVWQGLVNGTFDVFSSDHAPYRFDETGKLSGGPNATFKQIANGVPGLELRMPLLFSEGVLKGRLNLNQFVELTSTRAAKLYGIHPRKGTVAIGADADLAIWDPDLKVNVTDEMMHDNVGYTPYAGRTLTGWPVTVLSRGRVVVEESELKVERGSGKFLACERSAAAVPLGRLVPEMDPEKNFGAKIERWT